MKHSNYRVVFCFGSLELGGAERQGFLLADYLNKVVGARVEVWGFHGPGRLSELCDLHDIPWRIVPFPFARRSWKAGIEILGFSKLLRKEKVDVLIPYTTMPNLVCNLASCFSNVKVCAWNQRDEGLERFVPWVEDIALRIASPIISNSTGAAKFLVTEKNIINNKIFIIPNGISLDAAVESRICWRQKLGINDDCLVVSMVANLSELKDHETLIHAWAHIQNDFNNDAKLLIAGNQGNKAVFSRLKILVETLNLVDSISFLGRVDDMSGFLDSIDLLVHSSHSEGLPNAVLEAMHAGKAIIGTDIPGIRQALGDGYFYSPAGNAARMADLIKLYLNDDFLRDSIGKSNKIRAQNLFSVDRMCESMAEVIFKSILSK